METTDVPAKKYELLLVLSPQVSEENRGKELDEVRKYIASHKGEITFEDVHGMRKLAYRIRQQSQGFYAVLNFTVTPEALAELQKGLNINQAVLRYLLLTLPDKYEPKTLIAYDEEGARIRSEELKEKEEKRAKRMGPKPKARPAAPIKRVAPPKVRKPMEEITEKPGEEPKEELKKAAAKASAAKAAKSTLDDLDEKLKSIINDPDISL